jgi:hypothetical protein
VFYLLAVGVFRLLENGKVLADFYLLSMIDPNLLLSKHHRSQDKSTRFHKVMFDSSFGVA